ncbi:hypothetical protein NE237_016226 [Protea cynaroides]|uniref:EF-hand domain-containing protein n=1 Tax=Protea cynaroides TaxID=273540 RepID=A0A9Q0QRU1_9MAGN|nr:hypothetical protein NE237_016226 [Protea cynaroides]
MRPSGRTKSPSRECSARAASDFRPAFDLLDTDKDGKISPDDLREFYTRFFSSSGANVAKEDDINSMISMADSNKDGFVEYNEFEKVLCLIASQSQSPCADNWVMLDMFQIMDRDGDGKVGFDDLRTYMKWVGFQTSDEDIRDMIKYGGGDEHDGISFQGLLRILTFHLGDLGGK